MEDKSILEIFRLVDVKNVEIFLFLLYLIVIFSFVFLIITVKHSEKHDVDATSLIIENGEISLSKMGQVVALITSTWAIFYLIVEGKMTAEIFAIYICAWGAVSFSENYLRMKSRMNDSDNKWSYRKHVYDVDNPEDAPSYEDKDREDDNYIPKWKRELAKEKIEE